MKICTSYQSTSKCQKMTLSKNRNQFRFLFKKLRTSSKKRWCNEFIDNIYVALPESKHYQTTKIIFRKKNNVYWFFPDEKTNPSKVILFLLELILITKPFKALDSRKKGKTESLNHLFLLFFRLLFKISCT